MAGNAKQAYIEITYIPATYSAKVSVASGGENNVSNKVITESQGREIPQSFKGLYLTGGEAVRDPQTNQIIEEKGSLLNGAYKLFSDYGYPGWNSTSISNNTRENSDPPGYAFSTPPSLTFNGIQSGESCIVTINFDPTAVEYATQWKWVCGNTKTVGTNNRTRLVLRLTGSDQQGTLSFTRWSKANSVLKITRIQFGYATVYNPDDIVEVDVPRQDRDSWDKPVFGLSGLDGRIKVYNLDSEFNILREQGYLKSNLSVEIHAKEMEADYTLSSTTLVAKMYTQEWSADENSPMIECTLSDKIESLGDTRKIGLVVSDRTALQIYEYIFSSIGWVEGVNYRYGDISEYPESGGTVSHIHTKSELSHMTFPMSYAYYDSARNLLDKIAKATMCRIYTDYDGVVVVKKII